MGGGGRSFPASQGNPVGRGARHRQPNRRPAGEIDRTDNDRGDTGASARRHHRPRHIRGNENNKNLRSIRQRSRERRARPSIEHVSRALEIWETRGTRARRLVFSVSLLPDRT